MRDHGICFFLALAAALQGLSCGAKTGEAAPNGNTNPNLGDINPGETDDGALPACRQDQDCPGGNFCVPKWGCIFGSGQACNDITGCPDNTEYCWGGRCTNAGAIPTEGEGQAPPARCGNDDDCAGRTFCEAFFCVPGSGNSCANDADCSTGLEYCRANRCVDLSVAEGEGAEGEGVEGEGIEGEGIEGEGTEGEGTEGEGTEGEGVVTCASDAECRGGQQCVVGRCVTYCTAGTDCFDAQEANCDPRAGVCRACVDDGDCNAAHHEICRPLAYQCEFHCSSNADCTETEYCLSGACWARECERNADCAGGQACRNYQCVPLNCAPECGGKQCGWDGCGGECGSCAVSEICNGESKCLCAAYCQWRECGDDGCGGACGECPAGKHCNTALGACTDKCTPSCAGRACGDDSCGGSCGACYGERETCTAGGQCICVPGCQAKQCGPDGCGGACGECPAELVCGPEGTCLEPLPGCPGTKNCSGRECGPDPVCGEWCGDCPINWDCSAPGKCFCGNDCAGKCCATGDKCFDNDCCTPQCLIKECGNDGCGGSCGGCASGDSCNETTGKCGRCVPRSCIDQGLNCGAANDGCGGAIACGNCTPPLVCGGNGTPNVCECGAELDAAFCSRLGKNCGQTTGTDNCGNSRMVSSCGTCTAPQSCGGGGVANVCGCTPTTCAAQGKNCGQIPNGCGGTLNCGSCTLPKTCGGGGAPNVCGCTDDGTTCQGKECGSPLNNCGTAVNCGSCTLPKTCGGGGTPYLCGCTPETDPAFCTRLGKNCDEVSGTDNCGGPRTVASCGACSAPKTCGGGGVPNVCGCTDDGTACLGLECGTVTNNCGNQVSCGSCALPKTCGGGGTPNICGCAPETDPAFCTRLGKNCGEVSGTDNCGGPRTVASCGTCTAPQTCGGGGQPNVCGGGGAPHLWSKRFGASDDDQGRAVAVDGSGNVFASGYFYGTVDFGGGNLTSAGGADIFLAKYNSSGTHLWSKRFGAGSNDKGLSVAVDGSGNVFATGYFQGTVDFGGGSLTSAGGTDIFLAKFNSSGTHLWSKRFGASSSDYGYSVAVDGSGNVFATGDFQGTVDFGGGGLSSAGSYDIFLAKFNSSGTHLWSKRFGGSSSEQGNSVAVDGSGYVFMTGFFQGTVDFGGGSLTSAGGYDIFLAKYNSSGSHSWSKRFGGTGEDVGLSLAVDGSANVLMTGYFNGTVDFGGGGLNSAGLEDIFLAKYTSSGSHSWSKRFGGTSWERGLAIAVDGSGNVFMTGYFYGTAEVGGGYQTSAGLEDIFLAKYNSSGSHLWSKRIGGTKEDRGLAIAVDGSVNVFVTGHFGSTVDFGGGGLVCAGVYDIFLAKYGP